MLNLKGFERFFVKIFSLLNMYNITIKFKTVAVGYDLKNSVGTIDPLLELGFFKKCSKMLIFDPPNCNINSRNALFIRVSEV